MEFKEILLDLLLEKNGASQTNLSKQTGIPIPTINGWLTKNKLPRAEHFVVLSKYYNVSVDYLLGLENYGGYGEATNLSEMNKENYTTERTKTLKTIITKLHKMNIDQLDLVKSVILLLEGKAKIVENDKTK